MYVATYISRILMLVKRKREKDSRCKKRMYFYKDKLYLYICMIKSCYNGLLYRYFVC